MRISLGILFVAELASLSGTAQAQDVTIPGVYATGCSDADFPASLPSLDAVLDSAAFTSELGALRIEKKIVVTVVNVPESGVIVRTTDKKVSNEQASAFVQLVEKTLRAGITEPYAVRIRLDPPKVPGPVVERSKICAPGIGQRNLATATAVVRASDIARMQSEFQQNQATRARQRFHVFVSEVGKVVEVKVMDGAGDQAGADANTRSLRARSYTAATVDGIKVGAWLEVDGQS